jgi:Ca2+/Na+ antiporter
MYVIYLCMLFIYVCYLFMYVCYLYVIYMLSICYLYVIYMLSLYSLSRGSVKNSCETKPDASKKKNKKKRDFPQELGRIRAKKVIPVKKVFLVPRVLRVERRLQANAGLGSNLLRVKVVLRDIGVFLVPLIARVIFLAPQGLSNISCISRRSFLSFQVHEIFCSLHLFLFFPAQRSNEAKREIQLAKLAHWILCFAFFILFIFFARST